MTTYNTQHAAYVAEGREDEAHRAREERARETASQIAWWYIDQLDLDTSLADVLTGAVLSGMKEGMPE